MAAATLDPRTPVIVGRGLVTQRVEEVAQAREAFELMAMAMERAAEDAATPRLLAQADSIRVPQGLWKYRNPARALGERFGAESPETVSAGISGTGVQSMLNDAAVQIREGKRDVVVIVGGEAEHSTRRARREGGGFEPSPIDGGDPDRVFGARTDWRSNPDIEAGLMNPTLIFALFETAMRHHRGESVEAHRQRIATLWSGLARVAAVNPNAWVREPPDVGTIARPGSANRMIVSPYTKFLVANMVVDQAAALILTSLETARRLGISEERFVYPHAGTDAVVVRHVSERNELFEEPPMRIAGQRVYELAGVGPDDLEHVDLYSCFPAAVQLGAEALDLPLDRALTVTGGLTFHGGPFNNYVIHAIATLVDKLREQPGATGLVSSVGGFFSKHAFGVYASRPPERPFQFEDVAERIAALPGRRLERDHVGPAAIETYAVVHEQGAPTHAIIACRTANGARTWGRSEDPEQMARLIEQDLVGEAAHIGSDRSVAL